MQGVTDVHYAQKLDELDRLLNDLNVPIQPTLIWRILGEISDHEAGAPPRFFNMETKSETAKCSDGRDHDEPKDAMSLRWIRVAKCSDGRDHDEPAHSGGPWPGD